MTTVMIIRGLPGTGKDAYLDSLAKEDGLTIARCSADDYFMQDGKYVFDPMKLTDAHDSCFKSFVEICDTPMCLKSNLHEGDTPTSRLDAIAVCNTNTSLFEISPYLMYARHKKLPIEIVEISAPGVSFEHLAERNLHGVPAQGIEGMMGRWEKSLPFWPQVTKVESRIGSFTISRGEVEGGIRTIPMVKSS